MAAEQTETFYTLEEAAELLKVSSMTVRRLAQQGKIDYYRVGVQIRIKADEIERLKVSRKA